MNDNTTKLLEQLSQKMGTTSEYLWKVLLKQAPIDATISLIQTILIIFFGLMLYKIHKYLMKWVDSRGYNGYEKYEEAASVPMIVGMIVFIILFIYAFCCIENVISGYFNPEYWALNRVLSILE